MDNKSPTQRANATSDPSSSSAYPSELPSPPNTEPDSRSLLPVRPHAEQSRYSTLDELFGGCQKSTFHLALQHETTSDLLSRLRVPAHLIEIDNARDADPRPLYVPRFLLTQASPLLDGAIKSNNTLPLRIGAEVMGLFIYWLYHGQLPEVLPLPQVPSDHERRAMWLWQIALISAWTFGDEWKLALFQNLIMTALFQTLLEESLHAMPLVIGLRESRPGSHMRYALIAYMIWWNRETGRDEGSCPFEPRSIRGFQEDFMFVEGNLNLEDIALGERISADVRLGGRERPRAAQYFV